MVHSSLPDRLSTKVRTIEDLFSRDGLSIRSMKKAGSLELMPGVDGDRDATAPRLFEIDRLEETDLLMPCPVQRIAPRETHFRYFLDGAQKTLPIWRVGVVPVVVTFAVVGILERDPNGGEPRLLPHSLREEHAWLIPRKSGVAVIDTLIDHLEDRGEQVLDPIDDHPRHQHLDYPGSVGEFNRLVDCAYATANDFRARLEQLALAEWKINPEKRFPDGWMVVDGPLRDNHDRCIGLVKNLLTQHVRGREAEVLFDLAQGHRTTAFRIAQQQTDDDVTEQQGRTNWYMRFWNAEGFDARHALIRIEAPHQVEHPEEIDAIASWVLAERLPRPTDDPRWPTLLYPIHFLEKILKRKLASITVGWPA